MKFGTIATLVILGLTSAAFADEAKPNIVYILADDQGYADAGFMGSKAIKTPNLDSLAAAGTILKSYYVQPICSPTRASFLTGRFVSHTGVYTVVRPGAPWGLPLGERTLATALREAGYETAICGKWHLGEFEAPYRPMQRGFDHQYGLWFGNIDYMTHQRDGVLDWHRNDELCKDEGYSTQLIAEEACKIIQNHSTTKPLFLYVPFNAVHFPYQVPDRYEEPFHNLKGTRRTYAGMMAAMDEGVGEIVAALKEKGMTDNTLVIFSSDNGGPNPGKITSNDPLRAGKGTIYEGGIRVCAFVNWPGKIAAGKTIDEPLHIVDWYPTLLKLAGGSLDQKLPLDGQDIWPVITAGAKSPHASLFLPGKGPNEAALRMGDWKLLQHGPGRYEMFNLANDVGEKHNLAGSERQQLATMKAEMQKWLATAVPPGEPAGKGEPAGEGEKKEED